MRITRKKSTPITPQSPPQEIYPTSKNKKDGKEQVSRIISPNTISMHIKRAVEGITSKIEKKSIEKIIMDSETEEGCEFLINSFIDVFERNSNSDSIMLKSLEVIYILLNISNSTFRTKMQYIMPEILTITTLNFKKPEVKYRKSVHILAKAIYLNLQSNIPFPSPTKLGLIEDFSQFILNNVEHNNSNSRITENKSSYDFEYEKDNEYTGINDDNQKAANGNIINDLIDTSAQQGNPSTSNIINANLENPKSNHNSPDQNKLDIDLIDCYDANDKPNKCFDDSNNGQNMQTAIENDHSHHSVSKAKQAFDEYLSKSGKNDNRSPTSQDNSDKKEIFDNLLLMPDDSYRTSSNTVFSSTDALNTNKGQIKVDVNTSANISQNITNNLFDDKSSNEKFYFEADPALVPKSKHQTKNFVIRKETNEIPTSPNIPKSQSLQNKMPLILGQVPSSHLNPNPHDSNQIIDLTIPDSAPNSPPSSLMNSTQSTYFDSILNSQPNTTPSKNFDSPKALDSPSTFIPPSNFNSPESSNYNSDSASNFQLNSSQYSSQLSKSNSVINSNLGLASDGTLNSVSDSILKIPSKELINTSKSSEIQILNSPSKFKSNIHLDPSNSTYSLNETSDSSTMLQLNGNDNQYANNIRLNPKQEKKKINSSRFSVKHESSSKNSKEENSTNSLPYPKTKTNFKIEIDKTSGNSESSKLNQHDNPIDSSLSYSPNQDSLINDSNNYTTATATTTSNNFSKQDLFNSSVQTSNIDDNFQVGKPSFNLDDLVDQFEPITPIHSQNIQVFNDQNPKTSPVPSSSIINTNDETSNAVNEQIDPLTPVRNTSSPQPLSIDDPLIQFTPIRSSNIENIIADNNNDIQNNSEIFGTNANSKNELFGNGVDNTGSKNELFGNGVKNANSNNELFGANANSNNELFGNGVDNTGSKNELFGNGVKNANSNNELFGANANSNNELFGNGVKNTSSNNELFTANSNVNSNNELFTANANVNSNNELFGNGVKNTNSNNELFTANANVNSNNELFGNDVSNNSDIFGNGANNVNQNGAVSDDQFVPITPVRNSLGFLEDDLFAKSKSEGGVASFNSDQFVPITPVKEQLSSDDQFVPITPVKNSLDHIFDDEASNGASATVNNSSNKNEVFGQFVPISPSTKGAFSDDPVQNENNINRDDKLYDQFMPFEKNDNGKNQEANVSSSLSDQFVPISPESESIIPILSNPIEETNQTQFPGIMRGGKNNFNNILSASPRSRHLSFDSGLLSPSGNDRFEAITPPNAKSLFYNNQAYNKFGMEQIVAHVSKSDSEDGIANRNENSFADQFEPITPPSSLRNRSQIEDLIQSSNDDVVQKEPIFNQNNIITENKFDESLDKKINAKAQKTGSNHLVSFEITKQNKNQQMPQNDLGNFDFNSTQISKSINENTNLDMSFESFGANNYSKSQEHFLGESNSPKLRAAIPNGNQPNRFRMSYIKRNSSPQKFNGDDKNNLS